MGAYRLEVTAPVRVEPSMRFRSRRVVWNALRCVEQLLGIEGYVPCPGGRHALMVLVAIRGDGTERVRIVRRYRVRRGPGRPARPHDG